MRIKRFFMVSFLALTLSLGVPIFTMAQEQEGEETELADGVYEGTNSMLDISVAIEQGKITDIKILEHRGGGEQYEKMILPLVDLMIERQSTEVDAITGATTSSNALKIAVEEALEKSKLSLQKKQELERYSIDLE